MSSLWVCQTVEAWCSVNPGCRCLHFHIASSQFLPIRTCFGARAGCSWRCSRSLGRRCTSEDTARRETRLLTLKTKCFLPATHSAHTHTLYCRIWGYVNKAVAMMMLEWVEADQWGGAGGWGHQQGPAAHRYFVLLPGYANFHGQMSDHDHAGDTGECHIAIFFGEDNHPGATWKRIMHMI